MCTSSLKLSQLSYSVFRFQVNLIPRTRIPLRQLSTNSSTDERVDRVSPPHSVSNLRLIKFGEPLNESEIEKQLRLRRIEVQEWNQNYWTQNNLDFQKQKSEFIEQELKASKEQEFKSGVSYDELALFYKRFLDANHRKHMDYNLEWYKRHCSLLWPSFKVFLNKINRKLFSKRSQLNKIK